MLQAKAYATACVRVIIEFAMRGMRAAAAVLIWVKDACAKFHYRPIKAFDFILMRVLIFENNM